MRSHTVKYKSHTSRKRNITDRMFLVCGRRCSFVGIRWMISSTNFLNCWKSERCGWHKIKLFVQIHCKWLIIKRFQEHKKKLQLPCKKYNVEPNFPHLCWFLLKKLHLAVLKKCEEARNNMLQKGWVLGRRCHILKLIEVHWSVLLLDINTNNKLDCM